MDLFPANTQSQRQKDKMYNDVLGEIEYNNILGENSSWPKELQVEDLRSITEKSGEVYSKNEFFKAYGYNLDNRIQNYRSAVSDIIQKHYNIINLLINRYQNCLQKIASKKQKD